MLEDGRSFSRDEIVIDPAVPAAARRALADMYSAGQQEIRRKASRTRRFSKAGRPKSSARVTAATGGQLLPYRQSPPRAPVQPAPTAGRHALRWGALALIFLIGALLAGASGSIGFIVILLIATAAATVSTVRNLFAVSSASQAWARQQWNIRYAGVYWHRRYIVPRTDLDDEARAVWARAVAAANEVCESHVVQWHIVDSVQVAMALPQRLWEIAEGLAGLSQARGRQREILRQGGSDGQRVAAAKVSSQDQRMKIEARRLEGRVRKLEEIASFLRKADAAKRSELVLGRLDEVDELLGDLRARSADIAPDLDPAERLRLEAQAVIDQANEAARDLALPDLGEQDDSKDADAV